MRQELQRRELKVVQTTVATTPLRFTATWIERDADPFVAAVADLAGQVARAKHQKS